MSVLDVYTSTHSPHVLRFLHELSCIVQFSERVWCFLFQTSFSEALASLASKVETITKACKVGTCIRL